MSHVVTELKREIIDNKVTPFFQPIFFPARIKFTKLNKITKKYPMTHEAIPGAHAVRRASLVSCFSCCFGRVIGIAL